MTSAAGDPRSREVSQNVRPPERFGRHLCAGPGAQQLPRARASLANRFGARNRRSVRRLGSPSVSQNARRLEGHEPSPTAGSVTEAALRLLRSEPPCVVAAIGRLMAASGQIPTATDTTPSGAPPPLCRAVLLIDLDRRGLLEQYLADATHDSCGATGVVALSRPDVAPLAVRSLPSRLRRNRTCRRDPDR
jgi:hypothetical protein